MKKPVVAYKVFTSTLCPPVQGGSPVWNGELPFALPAREVDRSALECGAGWNACKDASTALDIAGLWPDGHPSRVFEVRTDAEVVKRGDKLRSTTWRIVRELTPEEVAAAIKVLSAPFGDLQDRMTESQLAWREALGRPLCDEAEVQQQLRVALDIRGLQNWTLHRFESVGDARAAWAVWAALTVEYAVLRKWADYDPLLLTTGIREAYRHGLEIALPTSPNELGWVARA